MVSIRSIISNNNATFFDLRSEKRLLVWPRISAFIILSPPLAFLLNKNLTEFINSINTVLSILLGFGFSVLFFIASEKEAISLNGASLETGNRIERINRLSKELFHNVSYFVMMASAALAVAMVVIAPEANDGIFFSKLLPLIEGYYRNTANLVWWISLPIRSILFFLIIEAGYTFARIVGRVNFLFEEKLKLKDRNDAAK